MEYLMEGVEILSKNDIVTFDFNWHVFFICFSIGIIIGILTAELDLFVLAFSVMTLLGIFSGYGWAEGNPTGKYEYKVTISDNVSLTDFNNKYEIINQDGKIYTVKEREGE